MNSEQKNILKGAEPFLLKGKSRVGVLCIHGFTGSPWDFRELGSFLSKQGFWVAAPLLAGHGTSPEDLAKTKWQDWYDSAEKAYFSLAKKCPKIFVVGISLGANLGFLLAEKHSLAGVISIGGISQINQKFHLFALLGKILWPFFPYYKKGYHEGRLPQETIARRVGYKVIPLRAVPDVIKVKKLMVNILPKITCPALLIQAKSDHAVAKNNLQFLQERLGSKNKRILEYDAYHVVIVDPKVKKEVNKEILNFISQ